MFWQDKVESWAENAGKQIPVPARLVLWDGREMRLGHPGQPKVVLYVKQAAALRHLRRPTIDGLAQAYVNDELDIHGRMPEAIALAYGLAHDANLSTTSPPRFSRVDHDKQSDRRAIQFHYDVSDDFYRIWLGRTMVYSCAYFENGTEDLDTAQEKKIDHILKKIALQPTQSLLDIGCGWGSLVIRAAQKFGARCIGITLSEKQYQSAMQRVQQADLTDRVEIRLQDYREIAGQFDRITSVGMFEHVGRANLPAYFAKISSLLTPDGIAMNHGITSTDPDICWTPTVDGRAFIDKYVFPNGELSHIGQVLDAMQRGNLESLDVENLRRHYARTLTLWADAFEKNADLIRQTVGEQTFRVWRIYLAGCAYGFRCGNLSIYQIVCRKAGAQADSLAWSRRYMYD
jgi:cyclopropane-fatty-acyl-phospholipid synthase